MEMRLFGSYPLFNCNKQIWSEDNKKVAYTNSDDFANYNTVAHEVKIWLLEVLMWETEHSQFTDVTVDRLWSVFEGVHSGRITLPGGDVFRPEGPLGLGTKIEVTPAGQETMVSKIVDFVPGSRYADETEFNGLILRFAHQFDEVEGGTMITHRLTISGDGADHLGPEIGPQISEDFPEQMDALIAEARRA